MLELIRRPDRGTQDSVIGKTSPISSVYQLSMLMPETFVKRDALSDRRYIYICYFPCIVLAGNLKICFSKIKYLDTDRVGH